MVSARLDGRSSGHLPAVGVRAWSDARPRRGDQQRRDPRGSSHRLALASCCWGWRAPSPSRWPSSAACPGSSPFMPVRPLLSSAARALTSDLPAVFRSAWRSPLRRWRFWLRCWCGSLSCTRGRCASRPHRTTTSARDHLSGIARSRSGFQPLLLLGRSSWPGCWSGQFPASPALDRHRPARAAVAVGWPVSSSRGRSRSITRSAPLPCRWRWSALRSPAQPSCCIRGRRLRCQRVRVAEARADCDSRRRGRHRRT